LSTFKQIVFVAPVIALHGLGTQLVLVAQLGLVVAAAARRKLGNAAAAAARRELGEQLVFVVAVATRRGPGTKAALVAKHLHMDRERTFQSGRGVSEHVCLALSV
jgi:hypothetical protein